MIYSLGQNIVYPRYQKRKIGKRLHTHKCYEPNKSVTTVMMNTGNGGVTGDGDIIQGGSDIALVIENTVRTQKIKWDEDCRQMDKVFKRFASGGIAGTSMSLPPCRTIER